MRKFVMETLMRLMVSLSTGGLPEGLGWMVAVQAAAQSRFRHGPGRRRTAGLTPSISTRCDTRG